MTYHEESYEEWLARKQRTDANMEAARRGSPPQPSPVQAADYWIRFRTEQARRLAEEHRPRSRAWGMFVRMT